MYWAILAEELRFSLFNKRRLFIFWVYFMCKEIHTGHSEHRKFESVKVSEIY